MKRVSVELVPREEESLRGELELLKKYQGQVNVINIPDLLRLPLRSWEGAGLALEYFSAAMPHIRAMDIDLDRELPMKEFLELVDQRILDDTKAMNRFLEKTSRREDLRKSLYIHGALKRICHKYGLSGFTLRCFDLLKTRQQTSCLAFGMLNDEGIVATCEGDVPTLLTMVLAKELTGKPSFMANPSEIDVAKGEAIYAHCTCPFSMVRNYTLATHFESGLGFGIRGEFPKGKMTMVKLSQDLTKFRALSCRVIENPLRADLCRSQIRVRFDDDIAELVENPYGNHMAFLSGDVREELLALFDYLTK